MGLIMMITGMKFIYKSVIPLLLCSFLLTGCFWVDILADYRQNLVNAELDKKRAESSSTLPAESSKSEEAVASADKNQLTVGHLKKKYQVIEILGKSPINGVMDHEGFKARFTSRFTSDYAASDIISVHTDKQALPESDIYANTYFSNEASRKEIRIEPPSDGDSTYFSSKTDDLPQWNADSYYIRINYDLKTAAPTKLEKPIIIPFSIASDTDYSKNAHDRDTVPEPDILEEVSLNADSAIEEYLARFLIHGQKRISLQAFPEVQETEDVYDVFKKVVYQNPLIIGVEKYLYNSSTNTLTVYYQNPKKTMQSKQQETVQEAKSIIHSIVQDDMNDEEKRQAIYNYLEQNAIYDDDAYDNSLSHNFEYVDPEYEDAFSTYGVMVEKLGVCMSYAYSYKLLADLAGIDNVIVTGTLDEIPHAWNKVSIGGEWLNVDSTNGATNAGVPYFLYNSNDEMADELGYIEDMEYWLDEDIGQFIGSTNKHDYYVVHDLEVSTLTEYRDKLTRELQNGAPTISLRLLADMDEEDMEDVISKVYSKVAPELLGVGEYYEIGSYVVFYQ
ncbi:Transglutaminase-like superfamily protein [compost metagenome]